MPWVECIPNFSDGRRPGVIEAIVGAIESAPVHVLDVSSDSDHNRTVVTFAGEPQSVAEAAFRGIQKATELIDLETHQGVHPRIGAADVVPFVPLRDSCMADCVQLAHDLARRVGKELNLPVYCYEAAAFGPKRKNLADVRRGGYERLKERIASNRRYAPDFGPRALSPAGAVAIGARGPLIAFNAFLDTDDVQIARKIARAVRTSGGGLPALKAMGVLVAGKAQVSMNLVDFRQTSLDEALGAVREQARREGYRVTDTEVVGLLPQAALLQTALDCLQLPAEAKDLILETHVGAVSGDYREIVFE